MIIIIIISDLPPSRFLSLFCSYLAGLSPLLDHFHAWKLSLQEDFLDFWIILAGVPSLARRSLTQRARCAPLLIRTMIPIRPNSQHQSS